ncbi:hypothetical protein ACLI4R_17580 [Natrialbaceae archaeon A-chndr2]
MASENNADDASIDDVRDKVEDALSDRFTREVRIDKGDVVVAVLGGQYGIETANEIAREDVAPAVPGNWRVTTQFKGVFGYDTCHIKVQSPEYLHHNRHLDAIAGNVNGMSGQGFGGDDE